MSDLACRFKLTDAVLADARKAGQCLDYATQVEKAEFKPPYEKDPKQKDEKYQFFAEIPKPQGGHTRTEGLHFSDLAGSLKGKPYATAFMIGVCASPKPNEDPPCVMMSKAIKKLQDRDPNLQLVVIAADGTPRGMESMLTAQKVDLSRVIFLAPSKDGTEKKAVLFSEPEIKALQTDIGVLYNYTGTQIYPLGHSTSMIRMDPSGSRQLISSKKILQDDGKTTATIGR